MLSHILGGGSHIKAMGPFHVSQFAPSRQDHKFTVKTVHSNVQPHLFNGLMRLNDQKLSLSERAGMSARRGRNGIVHGYARRMSTVEYAGLHTIAPKEL